MCRIFRLLVTCLLCSPWSFGDARAEHAKTVTMTGCSYEGLEGCHYLLTTGGQNYQLAPEFWIPMPPPNRIVTVTGLIRPKQLGFCTAKNVVIASSVVLTGNSCRPGPRRKRAH